MSEPSGPDISIYSLSGCLVFTGKLSKKDGNERFPYQKYCLALYNNSINITEG